MLTEKQNWGLRLEREAKKEAYEERVIDDIVNKPQMPNLAFRNFIETAVKDFTMFENRLDENFHKH